ncbi:unnamed protein product, partial [Rhizopus stolonifer]
MTTTIARCSNTVPDEKSDNDNRPDYKPTVNMFPTLVVNNFYRLTIFTKDALDIFHLRQSLAFHAIEKTIAFFVMSLSHPQLYTFTELVRIQILTKKSDLLNFMGHLNNSTFISSVHKNDCVPLKSNLDDFHYDTRSTTYVEDCQVKLISKKRSFALTMDWLHALSPMPPF